MADQGAEGLLSPWLRKQRLVVAKPHLDGRVLDFGCGSGALAELVAADHYVGVEVDDSTRLLAQASHPSHDFVSGLSELDGKFDSIIALAVIEHVDHPEQFLKMLAGFLNESERTRLIVTTPHPSVDWIHHLGAAMGLFSKHANEEHQELLDRAKLEVAGHSAGLTLVSYRRFLFGANQIAIFKKNRQ